MDKIIYSECNNPEHQTWQVKNVKLVLDDVLTTINMYMTQLQITYLSFIGNVHTCQKWFFIYGACLLSSNLNFIERLIDFFLPHISLVGKASSCIMDDVFKTKIKVMRLSHYNPEVAIFKFLTVRTYLYM